MARTISIQFVTRVTPHVPMNCLTAVTPGVTTAGMGHPLADARRAANLTQQELARMAQCDRQSIARIETNRQTPSLAMVRKITSALRVKNVNLSADVFLPEQVTR